MGFSCFHLSLSTPKHGDLFIVLAPREQITAILPISICLHSTGHFLHAYIYVYEGDALFCVDVQGLLDF